MSTTRASIIEQVPSSQVSPRSRLWHVLRRDGRFWVASGIIALFALMAAVPQVFTSGDPFACDITRSLIGPGREHWFGFDLQGCDLYTQAVYGARASFVVAALVVIPAALIGVILGGLAGFYGGPVDVILGRLTDLVLAVPLVLGGLVVLAFLDTRGVAQVAIVLAILAWPPVLRLVRARVLALRSEDYVLAARALGASGPRVLSRHIVPNSLGPVFVFAAAYTGVAISAEALLSFMGVGLQMPAISWGVMLGGSADRLATAPHLLLPGIFLVALVTGFVLLGEALRIATNPARQ